MRHAKNTKITVFIGVTLQDNYLKEHKEQANNVTELFVSL